MEGLAAASRSEVPVAPDLSEAPLVAPRERVAEEVEVERKRREEVAARLAVLQSRVCSR